MGQRPSPTSQGSGTLTPSYLTTLYGLCGYCFEGKLGHIIKSRFCYLFPDPSQRATKIFVGGLSPSVNDAELKEYFSQFGTIVEASVSYGIIILVNTLVVEGHVPLERSLDL